MNTLEPVALSTNDYARFRDLIVERTGMHFDERRHAFFSRCIHEASVKAGGISLEEYFLRLSQAQTDSDLWHELVSRITVGETYFFRDAAQFSALRQHILPEMIARHQEDRRLRLWSAGCASGEEPYSLAILLQQILPELDRWNISILGTDINRRALSTAQHGRYRLWSFRQTEKTLRDDYFTQEGEFYRINHDVRRLVTFEYLNLSEDCYPSLTTNTNALDLILFRNVAIYLPPAVTRQVSSRFHRCLLPEGWLMVGAAETNSLYFPSFTIQSFPGASAFRKDAPKTPVFHHPIPDPAVSKPPPASVPPLQRPIPVPVPLPAFPALSPEGLYRQGLALVQTGRTEQALETFQACIARLPNHAQAYFQIGRLQANRGKLDEAVAACQKALELDPLLAEVHYALALIYQEEGGAEQALVHLKKALYLKQDFILAHFSLSNIYQQAGQPREAARHRAHAARLASSLPTQTSLPGSEDLTAGQLIKMINIVKEAKDST